MDESVRTRTTGGRVTVTQPENLLRRLARINPTTAFFAALVLMVAGLFLPGIVGAALLFVLFAGLVALTFTTWPVQTVATRVVRVILLALLLASVIAKIT
jgi:prepilin signal peptidase PulO-like enzyme (type II secretory pathway)